MTRPRRDPSRTLPAPRGGGFRHAARLVEERLRAAGAARGFAVARLLTHWDEIVGPDTARLARPLRLSWARGRRAAGVGATLTLATGGAAAPLVQMLAPQIRDRVNACLGHAAVARIVLVQIAGAAPAADAPPGVAAQGLAEAGPGFDPGPPGAGRVAPALAARAAAAAEGVRDPALRAALEALARNVLSRADPAKGPTLPCHAS